MKVIMKPETIARRAIEREQAKRDRHASLLGRTRAAALAENDPSGFWADMLRDIEANEAVYRA